MTAGASAPEELVNEVIDAFRARFAGSPIKRIGRDRMVRNIMAKSPIEKTLVASANPGCLMHLQAAGLVVKHPVDILAEALGLVPTTVQPREKGTAQL